jgi:hypothetical protein
LRQGRIPAGIGQRSQLRLTDEWTVNGQEYANLLARGAEPGDPPEACEPLGVEAIHRTSSCSTPTTSTDAVRAALQQQAADLHPPWQLDELLRALTTAGVPRFADAIGAKA